MFLSLYLSFILKESGHEDCVEHMFGTVFPNPEELLYIEICYYCVKVYFKYNYFDDIIGKTLELVEALEPYE